MGRVFFFFKRVLTTSSASVNSVSFKESAFCGGAILAVIERRRSNAAILFCSVLLSASLVLAATAVSFVAGIFVCPSSFVIPFIAKGLSADLFLNSLRVTSMLRAISSVERIFVSAFPVVLPAKSLLFWNRGSVVLLEKFLPGLATAMFELLSGEPIFLACFVDSVFEYLPVEDSETEGRL